MAEDSGAVGFEFLRGFLGFDVAEFVAGVDEGAVGDVPFG